MLATTDLCNRDKMLPSHPVMRQLFRGGDAAFWRRLEEVTTSVLPIRSVGDALDIQLKPGVTYETLGSDLATLYHMQLLIRLMGCRRVLEVGTFVGVSAMFMADAMDGGVVTTIEVGAEFAGIARENFRRNGYGPDRIELINGDAIPTMAMLAGRGEPFDLVFLDGGKEHYGTMLRPLLDLLRPGGLLYVDDTFLHGDVLNRPPATAKGRGVADLLNRVAGLEDHARVILPCGDGHLLVLKP